MSASLGILGGGQLGCLLDRAARDLGLDVRITDPDPGAPALALPGYRPAADWGLAVQLLAASCDIVTWEREDLSLAALAAAGTRLCPTTSVLGHCQDRLEQKRLFDDLGLPTATWLPASEPGHAGAVARLLGLPLMVKARRGGFDGRGQVMVRDQDELAAAIARFAPTGAIAERVVDYDDEFALLLTRGADGRVVHYPAVWTHQRAGQLDWALAPHPQAAGLEAWGRPLAARLASRLGHVGTLALECFRCGDRLLVNEVAPRVHNSGHWTIEGCTTSQFANHVRAVCRLPVLDPEPNGVCLLLNCIGTMPPPTAIPGLSRHDYRKLPRPRRKVGHLTLVAEDHRRLLERVAALPPALVAGRNLPTRLEQAA